MPRSSSRTRARTIERPVPVGVVGDPAPVVGDREHDLTVSLRQLDPDRVAAVLERVLEQLAEDERKRGRAPARERHMGERGLDALLRAQALHEHRAQPVEQLVEIDLLVAPLGQHLVHGSDREDPVDRVLERLPRVDLRRERAWSRSSEATVWRLFLTRWWISWARTPRMTARPCSSATAAW